MEGSTTSTAANTIKSFVESVMGGVTSNITLTDIATIIVSILGVTLVIYFAWVYGRKGLAAIMAALKGKFKKM